VKNHFKILNVILLTAIYCFAIGAVNNSLIHFDFSNNKSSSQEEAISYISEKLFLHTSHSECSVKDYNNLPAPNFKNHFTGLWAVLKAKEQLYGSEFSQYTTFTRTILINHRKSDIIFPFHYFW
jgi:hypothetical protein